MPERDMLESGLYQKAMDDVKFSADFEARTLERLKRELGSEQPKRRSSAVRRWATGLSAVAAVAVVGFVGVRMWLAQNAAPLDAPSEQSVTLSKPAMATSMPAAPSVASEFEDATAESAAIVEGADYGLDVTASGVLYEYEPGNDAIDLSQSMAVHATGMPRHDTAEYNSIREISFKDAKTEPLSTFAADVDTASYANARQWLAAGAVPPAGAVRTEEFLNYFSYDYPEPTGNEPFSVTTELAPCPWNLEHALMMVGLKAKDVDVSTLPPTNLVFLIDVSGSMDMDNKLPLAQKAFRMLIEQLRPQDRVSIVTYAGSDNVLIDGATGEEKMRIAQAIDSLFAGGSTDGASGIQTAYGLAQKHLIRGGNNRVILATDGDLNVGLTSESELTKLIEDKKQSGVFLSVMGFGQDNLKDNKLEALADHGNGNYSYIDSQLEAKKVLVEELGGTFFTVAKDVKLQVEFNPDRVKEYRLVGYENRILDAKDFQDDTKDGGEIGAGHMVTALYELVLADGQAQGADLKYQQSTTTGSSEYATVSVRAKAPDGDVSAEYTHPVSTEKYTDTPSNRMRFASAVAEVCLLLQDSEYKGDASYQDAADRLSGIEGLTADPYKDEFAYMVRQFARKQ